MIYKTLDKKMDSIYEALFKQNSRYFDLSTKFHTSPMKTINTRQKTDNILPISKKSEQK